MNNYFIRMMRIFEVMWLVAAAISLFMAVSRGIKGETFGNYIYITIFTAAVAVFMYRFKKSNRKFLEARNNEREQLAKAQKENKIS